MRIYTLRRVVQLPNGEKQTLPYQVTANSEEEALEIAKASNPNQVIQLITTPQPS